MHLNNEMGADVAAGNKREGDGRRQGRAMRVCSKTFREPWRLWSRGGMESNLCFKTVNRSHVLPITHM